MFRPIYPPRGRAQEYCDFAINIYDSCPHGCTYCYARAMAKRFGKPWAETVSARRGIVEATRKQLARPEWVNAGKKIMLCFTCDPYPVGHDSTVTREVIRAIKASGNHVQILTKGDETAQRDFDLLGPGDSFGVTLSGGLHEDEPGAAGVSVRLDNLRAAKVAGIKTWASCEPVLYAGPVLTYIRQLDFIDLWRIGKLNGHKSQIIWSKFGRAAKGACEKNGREFYIKEDLQKEMEVQP